MLVFAIKGNVINYFITIIGMNICISYSTQITVIIRLLLNINHRNNFHSTCTPLHSSRPSLDGCCIYYLLALLYFSIMYSAQLNKHCKVDIASSY